VLIEQAQALLSRSESWKGKTKKAKGKLDGRMNVGIEVSSQQLNDTGKSFTWLCRTTKHRKQDISFDELWTALGENRFATEMR
jgi:hypothetical protein